MTDRDYSRALDELGRMMNDPTVPVEPAMVWSLLAVVIRGDRRLKAG